MGYFAPVVPDIRIANTESSVTISSETTLQNVSALTIADLLASTRYAFEAFIRVQSPAAADIKIALSLPSGADLRWGTLAVSIVNEDTGTLTFSTSNSLQIISLRGTISIGSTAGDLVFQFAQNTTDAGNTLIAAASWIQTTQLPGGAA